MGVPRAQQEGQGLPEGPSFATGSLHWSLAITIAAIAFFFRLVPLLRGGGLFGLGNYDDSVYYAASTRPAVEELRKL